MSLREQLADRMFAAVNEAPPTEGVTIRYVMYRELALALADECIRQMEWARKQPLDALRIVQGADEHDGQYDGCSLCHYHKDWGTGTDRWKHLDHLAQHEPDCPTGQALAAPLTLAPEDWKP